ncbi:hypothetical protein CH254_18925 [Rhodococcus sp. 06-412-2C]|uniref:hypothetical protein n=1 Tax=unclassified Rhodococcus (in: high G+C Gram-positive bacteria) TaxID=192944 RepID=UPI000B9A7E00|nr:MULTISPECIES: hypothetical protein [unclassified Rhodococcus (in: high G+C Gram-positive bacteria)]OZC86059.1 hypothetical protein CH254_18925 [Rhodococcus sp. 06-412-2C]OZC99845.1 hypothetical protein CH279_07525 [Rhodococcus sp. 06-412-2B]
MHRGTGSFYAVALSLALLVSGCTIATDDGTATDTSGVSESTSLPTPRSDRPTSDPGVWSTAVPVEPLPVADLAEEFGVLESAAGGLIGLALVPVGGGPATVLGTWTSGVAWSTVKVPMAVAALRNGGDAVLADAAAAIESSDNAAADALWGSLGDSAAAGAAVESVLRQGGDSATTIQRERIRPEFSAFGQTEWSTQDQATFAAGLSCIPDAEPVVEMMNNVVPEQQWGLGLLSDAAFKGGWGPRADGGYVVRQVGIVTTVAGRVGVAIAAQPDSGSFTDGTAMLDAVGDWQESRSDRLPAGHCL